MALRPCPGTEVGRPPHAWPDERPAQTLGERTPEGGGGGEGEYEGAYWLIRQTQTGLPGPNMGPHVLAPALEPALAPALPLI